MDDQPTLKPQPTLADIQEYVRQMVRHRNLNEANLHAEFVMLVEELGELAKAIRKSTGGKFAADTTQKEIEHEVADVLILLVGVSNMLGVDIERALRAKEAINNTRKWE